MITLIMMFLGLGLLWLEYLLVTLSSSFFWKMVVGVFACFALFFAARGLFRGILSIVGRLRFCAKLKKCAFKNGYRFFKKRSVLLPFFVARSGEDILLKKGDQIYRLKFFPYFLKGKLVHIDETGNSVFAKKMAISTFQNGTGKRFAPISAEGQNAAPYLGAEWLSIKKKTEKALCNENKQLFVILSPTPVGMDFVENGKRTAVDNGVCYRKNIVFYGTKTFLRYFDRQEDE